MISSLPFLVPNMYNMYHYRRQINEAKYCQHPTPNPLFLSPPHSLGCWLCYRENPICWVLNIYSAVKSLTVTAWVWDEIFWAKVYRAGLISLKKKNLTVWGDLCYSHSYCMIETFIISVCCSHTHFWFCYLYTGSAYTHFIFTHIMSLDHERKRKGLFSKAKK